MKKILLAANKAVSTFQLHGAWFGSVLLVLRIFHISTLSIVVKRKLRVDLNFDQVRGIETSEVIPVDDLKISERISASAVEYVGTHVKTFECMMKTIKVDPRKMSFVDIGAGKGRVLILASEYGFPSVTGVEVSPVAFDHGTNNLRSYFECKHEKAVAHLVLEDACTFTFPKGNLMIFLCNPFGGQVLSRFLEHLMDAARSENRRILLVYDYPWSAESELSKHQWLERTHMFRTLSKDDAWNAYEVRHEFL